MGFFDPLAPPGQERLDIGMKLAVLGLCLFFGGFVAFELCRLLTVSSREFWFHPEFCKRIEMPWIEGERIFTALYNVIWGAIEADVHVVVMWKSRLTCDCTESLDRLWSRVDPVGFLKQQRAKVLCNENAINGRFWIGHERGNKGPRSRNIELYSDIVFSD